jgi:cephalosporin-C deacetylase-like acetyl esterase
MKTSFYFLKLFFAVYGVAVFGMDADDQSSSHSEAASRQQSR